MLLLAKEGAGKVETAISGNYSVVESVARQSEIKTMDWNRQLPVLLNHMEKLSGQGYLGMGIVYPDGTTLYADGSEANLGNRSYVQKAFAGETNVSDVLISRVTNSAVMMYATPVYNDGGNVVGVLVARRPGDALTAITDEMGYGENGFAFIIGPNGTFFAQENRDLIMNQVNIFTEIEEDGVYKNQGLEMQKLGLENSGVVVYDIEGITRMVGVYPMKLTGWSFGVGALETEVLARFDSLRTGIYTGAFVFVVLGIIVALFIGRVISKQIVRASEFATSMAAGDLTEHIDERFLKLGDEVGDSPRAFETLGESFRQTISEIQNSAQDLAASSEEMSAIAESSSANMEEVSASTEEISASLEEVSAAAQQIADSSQQMNALTSELVKNMVEGNKSARKTEENATKVQADVEVSQRRSQEIYTDLDARMKEGIEKARIVNEISNMANQIAAIADQTNLLALNAAIEAARAGE